MSAEPALAQCSVTGKMVPEDELITLNGQRVCAEGKEILLQRLKAGESLPGEMEKPSVLRRFGCIFLDGLIIGVPTAVASGIVAAATGSAAMVGLVSIAATAIQLVYFGQMHASRGQTVGKMAGKLKVVNMDGSPIAPGTAYVRALVYAGPSFLSGLATLIQNESIALVASLIVGLIGLTTIVLALTDSKYQRALHDRVAGTRVVTVD